MTFEFGSPESLAILEADRELDRIVALKASPEYAGLEQRIQDTTDEIEHLRDELEAARNSLRDLLAKKRHLEGGKS